MRMLAATPLADILESEWDAILFRGPNALAKQLGWLSYHTLRSKGSRSGYPDRTLVRDRILWVELKREKTNPSDEQVFWLDKLAAAGGETYLWRPSDLDEIARILGKRWRYNAYNRSLQVDGKGWQPGSLWMPGVGRWDSQCVCGEINTRHCPVHGQGGNSQDAA